MSKFIAPDIKNFVAWDYVVFAALFLISSGIGVFFAIKERKNVTSKQFLVGGKQMTCGPVALSLTASFMSAVTVLGTPAEVYRYGAPFIVFFISYMFVIIFTSELFLPVFYRSGIISTYEYLELRFNRSVRFAATLIYIVQTILYTGVVVYAPALALNQVTGFNLWGSVFATGIVCTFYCTLGGLKAVVWTDAFQLVVMVIGFLTVLIQGTIQNGGLTNIWENANNGSRLAVFDFDVDPLRRHTFWTITVGGTFTWLGIYGVNQSTIQRCISCKSEKQAKLALYLNLVGLWVILVCAVFSGLVMYAHFKNCDPWTAGFISAPDQLMPYFVMDIFSTMPGLPGLFVACAFSGTLRYSIWSAVYFHGCGSITSGRSCPGPAKGKDVKPLLIRPVCNLFCFWSEKCKTLCWCGVQHDSTKVLDGQFWKTKLQMQQQCVLPHTALSKCTLTWKMHPTAQCLCTFTNFGLDTENANKSVSSGGVFVM
ncbi:Sodium-coupled monocarboxylate transporter 2 [Chelonia mydas]|uniref:Sodium-coupled monocarboxylate transporter 2 n=1 Tax=Chelonia mydas TaxID=8469 RepID=M7AS00_CHEMY|nr:Sodium-coupled monocarboxylate transporter 2 [Chelonia mydas]